MGENMDEVEKDVDGVVIGGHWAMDSIDVWLGKDKFWWHSLSKTGFTRARLLSTIDWWLVGGPSALHVPSDWCEFMVGWMCLFVF